MSILAASAVAVALIPASASAAARPEPAPRTLTAPSASGSAAAAAPVRVGSLDLLPCDLIERALCGTLTRAWDPTGAVPGTLEVGFAFVPAADTARPAVGTVVPHEGGPGYSTTGSAYSYSAMYGDLLDRRNMLLVDQRGTGLSAPIDCPELQELESSYPAAARRCAQRLGDRSHLYGTALSADDLAAVVTALGLGKVDVYGDSYGTFFAQVYAGRHPGQVRSVALDSAYPTFGETAWYPTQGPALRRAFDTVCRRTPSCAQLGGSTTDRIAALERAVRTSPIRGRVFGADGRRHRVVLDAPGLVYLAFNATYTSVTYRELDASIRAWFARRDKAPLLRLWAETLYPGGGNSLPSEYSEGADAAVSCSDYPQLYDMRATPAQRLAQLRAAVAARVATKPGTYAPFRIREYLRSDWATQDWCRTWPSAPAPYVQGPVRPPGGRYPAGVPVLVLSGELDTITTAAEGDIVARQWPRSRHIVVANSFHVTAIGDIDSCAEGLLRRFVSSGTTALPGRVTRCAAHVAPVRAAAAYRVSSGDAPAAAALPGSTRSQTRLRAVTSAAEAVADVLDRWVQTYEVGGVGLRGGRWKARGYNVVTFTLTRFRLVDDLAVSGSVRWSRYGNRVRVDLRLAQTTRRGAPIAGAAVAGRLAGTWDTRAKGARAVLAGRLGGAPVRASLLAP
jgi:pimeloyl-ACP methyl ester carboxylesterase